MHQIPKFICHKTLHVSGIVFTHHQALSNVHSATGTSYAGFMTVSYQSRLGTTRWFKYDRYWCV